MSVPKHSVKVSILNEEFTIRSDTPPDQTNAIADYFDQAARQVVQGSNVIEANRAVVLAALSSPGAGVPAPGVVGLVRARPLVSHVCLPT